MSKQTNKLFFFWQSWKNAILFLSHSITFVRRYWAHWRSSLSLFLNSIVKSWQTLIPEQFLIISVLIFGMFPNDPQTVILPVLFWKKMKALLVHLKRIRIAIQIIMLLSRLVQELRAFQFHVFAQRTNSMSFSYVCSPGLIVKNYALLLIVLAKNTIQTQTVL